MNILYQNVYILEVFEDDIYERPWIIFVSRDMNKIWACSRTLYFKALDRQVWHFLTVPDSNEKSSDHNYEGVRQSQNSISV